MTPDAYYEAHPELWEYEGTPPEIVPYWALPLFKQRDIREAMQAETQPTLFETRKETGYGVD